MNVRQNMGTLPLVPTADYEVSDSLDLENFNAKSKLAVDEFRKDKERVRKAKRDYRLFPLYQANLTIFNLCKPVLEEMFIDYASPELILSEGGRVYTSTSTHAKEAVDELKILSVEFEKRLNQIKTDWIKNKVIQTRFSQKGQHYAMKLDELQEAAVQIASLCSSIQIDLFKLTKGVPDEN